MIITNNGSLTVYAESSIFTLSGKLPKSTTMKFNFSQSLSGFFIAIISVTIALNSCQTMDEMEHPVQEAYELRLDGQLDSAIIMLEELTTSDPDNAYAFYELARATHHMGLGSPADIMTAMESSKNYVNQALMLEPENPIFLYYQSRLEGLDFYGSLQMGKTDMDIQLSEMEASVQKFIEVKPSCLAPILTMIEIYGGLPPEMGGDSAKAATYAKKLEGNVEYAALAEELMITENPNYAAYWKAYADTYDTIVKFQEALGKAFLWEDNVEAARASFEKVFKMDDCQCRKTLYLDIGRYYMLMAMQGRAPLDTVAPLIEDEFNKFLATKASKPLRAWTKGQLAMVKMHSGDQAAADALIKEAEALDPYYSKAFGLPDRLLFIPPHKFLCEVNYYFRPF